MSLDLYNNNLTGIIPPTLGNLQSLIFFDVSINDLCGTVPPKGPLEHTPLSKTRLIILFAYISGLSTMFMDIIFEDITINGEPEAFREIGEVNIQISYAWTQRICHV
ncbi:hypothetical protein AgCh_013435 [Apium graveolens]